MTRFLYRISALLFTARATDENRTSLSTIRTAALMLWVPSIEPIAEVARMVSPPRRHATTLTCDKETMDW